MKPTVAEIAAFFSAIQNPPIIRCLMAWLISTTIQNDSGYARFSRRSNALPCQHAIRMAFDGEPS
jgi:hypothetical protein